MFTRSHRHTLDYLILAVLLTSATLSIWLFRFTPFSAKLNAVFLAVAYFTWGVVHHKKAGHIDRKIVLEYLGLSLLSLAIIFSLL